MQQTFRICGDQSWPVHVSGGSGPKPFHVVLRTGGFHAFEVGFRWAVVFWNRMRLHGSPYLSEEARHSGRSEDGENVEWVVAADAKSVRVICWNESGHTLGQAVRLPVHVQRRHLPLRT